MLSQVDLYSYGGLLSHSQAKLIRYDQVPDWINRADWNIPRVLGLLASKYIPTIRGCSRGVAKQRRIKSVITSYGSTIHLGDKAPVPASSENLHCAVTASDSQHVADNAGQSEQSDRRQSFKPLRGIVIDCQSIVNKKAEVQHVVDAINPDIVVAVEIWLKGPLTCMSQPTAHV